MADIKLGQKVRDVITGLEGIAVARTEWLHGCVRVTIQPQELKDGKPVESSSFDEPQIEVIEDTPKAPPKVRTGGDRENIGRAPDPR